jgi:hypothetical protein
VVGQFDGRALRQGLRIFELATENAARSPGLQIVEVPGLGHDYARQAKGGGVDEICHGVDINGLGELWNEANRIDLFDALRRYAGRDGSANHMVPALALFQVPARYIYGYNIYRFNPFYFSPSVL